MINLLPEFEKKKLLKIYRLRIAVVALVVMLFIEVMAALLFLPAFYVLSSTNTNLTDELTQKRSVTPEGESSAQQELAAIKSEIAILKPGTDNVDTPPSVLLTEIFAQKPSGIRVGAISYARSLKNAAVQITGHAATSEDMLAFQKSLKEDPKVASTQYASNNFIIKKTDIDFVMTVNLR